MRSDNGGADGFTALGSGGNGVQVAAPIDVFTSPGGTTLSLGNERIAAEAAIAVDPNNANHVLVAYQNAPGADGAGVVQLVLAESNDGGATWSTKFTTSSSTRSSQEAISILGDGAIGFLYDSYDPATDLLSQHFLTTTNDFATTSDTTLATESDDGSLLQFEPYLGDFFDLTSVGNTFYGTFCASNADNGSGAQFANLSLQRDFTGTPGTGSFQLTDGNGHTVPFSIDPYFFTCTLQPPTVAGLAGASYAALASPVTLSAGLSLTDVSSTTLDSATVQITSGMFAGDGDMLAADTTGTAIHESYDSASETLTLTGSDTLADYQAVLRSVTFSSTSADPTSSGNDNTRTVTWSVNDGSFASTPQNTTITLSASPAVIANNPTVDDGQTVVVDPTIFTVSGAVTQYEVWFSAANQGAPALGSVTDNGTPIALNQGVYLTTLNSLDYTGGATAGTDEMWLRASNGNWSSWVQADITDPGNVPPPSNPGITPATVTAQNPTVNDGQTVVVDPTVFTVSGSGITEYEVWFSAANQGAPPLGSVTDNGIAIALNQGVFMTTLSGLDYTGGATGGTDEMWMRAYDGNWSGWVQANITDPGAPPATVTANNPTVNDGQTVAVDPTVFTVSGSGISEYEVWFSAANQGAPPLGSVTDNGTPIALNQGVYLTSLNGLDYTGGATTGTDEMWLRAYDGNWSGWVQADITEGSPGWSGAQTTLAQASAPADATSQNGAAAAAQGDGGQFSGVGDDPMGGNAGTSALWSGTGSGGWLASYFASYQSAGAMVAATGTSLLGSVAASDFSGAPVLMAGGAWAQNQATPANLSWSLDPIDSAGAAPSAQLPAPALAVTETMPIFGAGPLQHV